MIFCYNPLSNDCRCSCKHYQRNEHDMVYYNDQNTYNLIKRCPYFEPAFDTVKTVGKKRIKFKIIKDDNSGIIKSVTWICQEKMFGIWFKIKEEFIGYYVYKWLYEK